MAKPQVTPLRPYMTFTDNTGTLTKEAYDFLQLVQRGLAHALIGDPVVAPTPVPSGGPITTTPATNTVAIDGTGNLAGPYGFVTEAQAEAIITKLNAIITALVANGIMS